jgi:hypothetical protein
VEDYIFFEGKPPKEYQQNFAGSLFNEEKHLLLQAEFGWHSFYILNKRHKQSLAAIHFHLDEKIARSPLRNPYGSIDAADDIPNIILFNFLEFITSRLKDMGVEKIILKNPCTVYQQDQSSLLQTFLFNLGYKINEAEVSAVIQVSDKGFENFLDAWEHRKLRQSKEAGLVFEILPASHLSEVYNFIYACREERGYALSMSLESLLRTVEQFPNHHLLYAVKFEHKFAAASIAIKVREDILYNFHSAHPNEFNQLSPVVMLIEGMYEYCQQHNFRLLDLGTSALEGRPNFNLLDFKLRLGAKPYAKLAFEKNL